MILDAGKMRKGVFGINTSKGSRPEINNDLIVILSLPAIILINIMEKEPLVVSNKSCKTYFLLDGSKVYFTGDFDSGNLERAEQLSPSTVSRFLFSTV